VNTISPEVKYKELKLKSADGTDLFAREWKPSNNPVLAGAGYAMVIADLLKF
jgi:hypothetical protein